MRAPSCPKRPSPGDSRDRRERDRLEPFGVEGAGPPRSLRSGAALGATTGCPGEGLPLKKSDLNLAWRAAIAQSVALPQEPAPEWLRRSFRAFAERLRDHPLSRSSNESDR
jgi:hypothetical protein